MATFLAYLQKQRML